MRNNQPVTQQERTFPADQRLISTTDLDSIITYCNDALVEISGFTREELLGAPHNLVRHPDTPPAVFAHMWTTLKSGRPWMGIVKNRCKNGDHYWVSAYVTPVLDHGKVVGYESVRTRPTADQIKRAEVLYRRLNAGQPGESRLAHWLPWVRTWLPFLLISQVSVAVGYGFHSNWDFLVAALLAVPLGIAGVIWQSRGLKRLLKLAERSICDPLIALMYAENHGVEGRLEMALISQEAHLRTCLTRLQDTAGQIIQQASSADEVAHRSLSVMERQRAETEQVAAAVNQMAATTQEVASNVALTADATRQARQLTGEGRTVAAQMREAIEKLSRDIGRTGETVESLASDSTRIGGVVDVIRGISEQTNLLALNAAIEAARAGEMGRGFAVVADEVRSLAQRTAQSTEQIHELISTLQRTAAAAVQTMQSGREQADHGVHQVLLADQALVGINDAVSRISEMADQIAAAAEQQSSVAEEINRNVGTIAQLAEHTTCEAQDTTRLSESLTLTAKGQYALVERFNH